MPPSSSASAPGKIILSGEYAVLFGYPGIAIPSGQSIQVSWTADPAMPGVSIAWPDHESGDPWAEYARLILRSLEPHAGISKGMLTVEGTLPLGKGMGSSTALIVAVCRCLLGPDCAKIARTMENTLSPGNSGIDFAVIWAGQPVLFRKDEIPEIIEMDGTQLAGYQLVDTGQPGEKTSDLVQWMRSREDDIKDPVAAIGRCTERILAGEPLRDVMRDHHRAQTALGVVPQAAQKIIADIETNGGSAKIIGAGARTGGGGMVLALPPPDTQA